MRQIEKYGIFELELENGDLTEKTVPSAFFSQGSDSVKINGFLKRKNAYAVRFMPQNEGVWKYEIEWRRKKIQGEFECTENTGKNHGTVMTDGFHFKYADGAKYIPVGTTCYAWIHQHDDLIEQTLTTLSDSPYNKIRMCIFPKSMQYNNNDPIFFPFHRKADGSWDMTSPDAEFWKRLDDYISKLADLGIEADLILFHPYDRWGFSGLPLSDCLTYLDYCINRFSSYRNVWWSLANEYDAVFSRRFEDWQEFGNKIMSCDPYRHPTSVHNIIRIFPRSVWMSHCSIQSGKTDQCSKWREEYGLPVIVDECGYEGNIQDNWGNLSAFEFLHRYWTAVVLGGYCSHGETYHRDDEVLWWAKGGKLYGESTERIRFLKDLLYGLPGHIDPKKSVLDVDPYNLPDSESIDNSSKGFVDYIRRYPVEDRNFFLSNVHVIGGNRDFTIHYLGRTCPSFYDVDMPHNGKYRIEIIDLWNMTRDVAVDSSSGTIKVRLPGREGISVLITRLSGEPL
jgi:hypothetical protein